MTYINPRDSRVSKLNVTATSPLVFTGSCYCKKLTYIVRLASKDEACTTICHCSSCKKIFGSVFGVSVKVPMKGVKMMGGNVVVRLPQSDHRSCERMIGRRLSSIEGVCEAGLMGVGAQIR